MANLKSNFVTIGLIQTSISNDIDANIRKTVGMVRKAAKNGAQVVCLQELYNTGYFPIDENKEVGNLAETISGKSTSILSRLAKELGIVIIVPIFEVDSSGKRYNTAVVIDADGKILGSYRKVHIPYDPLFYEKSYFEVGNLGYRVFKSHYLTFGVLICYDQWYPEAARICALQGADVIFYPSAIGYPRSDPLPRRDWHSAWETIQRSHAIANSVHVASVNRVGREREIEFWGSSFVCDAFGKVLKRASAEKDEVLVAKLDISQNRRIGEGWGFTKNRRPETYGLITSQVLRGMPRELGYRMPAEWERHSATWLAWPHDDVSFPRLGKVEESYIGIIKNLHEGETVNLFVKDSSMEARVKNTLRKNSIDLKKVNFYVWDYADVWFRDYGPIFLVDKGSRMAMSHWTFNAWGEKYPELMKDSQIPYIISQKIQLDYFRPEIILEGGSVDVNGKGTLMTTEQCLLNQNRNPRLSKGEIEGYLKDYLGASHFIWLKSGIEGDDTDGHVDDVARFVAPRTVLCAYEDDKKDENYRALKENYDTLLESVDQDGKSLNVIKMPMPSPIHATVCGKKTRLPASYVNFYIANKAVLVPTFGDRKDSVALGIMQKLFPGRKVVGINCIDLLQGLGTIHCITQQQPAV